MVHALLPITWDTRPAISSTDTTGQTARVQQRSLHRAAPRWTWTMRAWSLIRRPTRHSPPPHLSCRGNQPLTRDLTWIQQVNGYLDQGVHHLLLLQIKLLLWHKGKKVGEHPGCNWMGQSYQLLIGLVNILNTLYLEVTGWGTLNTGRPPACP